ncbi:MAG TPA: prenyltransferase, partial [Geobacterales bacterium]|nr:prenyltransferase [Geobacterales bacterium]
MSIPVKRWINIMWRGQVEGDINSWDPLSKYLVMTRAVIDIITVISVLIAGLLAALSNNFELIPFLLCLFGMLLAHSGADLLNDYFDYKNGLDSKSYFRAQYMPHPILDGLVSERGLINMIIIHYVIAATFAAYLAMIRGPLIVVFTLLGIFFGYAYQAGPKLKYIALGEISTFIVWGPLMVGGSYFAITGSLDLNVFLISIPYALMVMLILFGKHIDKYESDKKLGVKTLPVVIGIENAKKVSIFIGLLSYIFIMIFIVLRLLPLTTSIIFLTIPFYFAFSKYYLSHEKKIWYVAASLWLNRFFGIFFVLGLLLALVLKNFGILL